MKNKKVLNICLLTFSLLALFTFILPISKFEFVTNNMGFVRVMFYILNAVLVVSLVAVVVFTLINLFQDNYKFVKVMEVMALVGFFMVFIITLIFAATHYAKINIGYLFVAVEMFACANFSQIARQVGYGAEIKSCFGISSNNTISKNTQTNSVETNK
jgi:hypothetical protein